MRRTFFNSGDIETIAEWAVKNGCPKDEYTSGRISVTTKAKRLELSVYVKVGELSQEVSILL